MPAHIKTVLIGESLTLPIRDGAPALGTWQGIYLCEHRDRAGAGGSWRPFRVSGRRGPSSYRDSHCRNWRRSSGVAWFHCAFRVSR